MHPIRLIGAAWGLGALDPGCANGPYALQADEAGVCLGDASPAMSWRTVIRPRTPEETISELCRRLALETEALVRSQQRFAVVGGDHSCAIGTWNGVASAMTVPPGLIWIDAHMDAHTPRTSPSGSVHGMPLAALLGYGAPQLLAVGDKAPALAPEQVCVLGVRSYEPEEARLLEQLGIRVFFMEEIRARGLAAVMAEALRIATHGLARFGVSIDLDAIDPRDAPGVGSPVTQGIRGDSLIEALWIVGKHPGLIGVEVAELNPARDDRHGTTAKLTRALLGASLGASDERPTGIGRPRLRA